MQTVLISMVVIGGLMAAMAIGVIMGRKPLKGSCGGVGAALGETDYVCDLCGNDPAKCEEEVKKSRGNIKDALFYELKDK